MKKRQGNEKMKQMKKIFPDMEAKKRAWLFALRVFFLCALCILPSYELVKSGMAKTVTMEDMETESLQLKDGETFSQTISIGSGTHVKSLAIGVDSVLDNENASIKVTIQRGDATYSRSYTQSEIPAKGFLELKEFDLSGTKAEKLVISVAVEELYGGSFSLQMTPELLHGYETAQVDGAKKDGALAIALTGWSAHQEWVAYRFLWIAVIFVLAVFVAWLLTYQTDNLFFERAVRISVFGLILSVFSLLYPSFLWYGCDWCEGIFYYRKIQENSLWHVIASSDFDLYMAQFNNIFMYLFVKVLHIDTYTFIACQLLSIGMIAYWGTLFCKKQYGKYFSMDFRVGAAVVAICYLYTMQEFSFIGVAYFGVLFLLYLITYDFSEDKRSFLLSIPVLIVMCLSKMTFALFCPISIFLLLLWRKKLPKRNRILLIVMAVSCLAEAGVSVLLNGGLTGGNSLGTIQDVTLVKLIVGAAYYAVQLTISVVFHEMNFANALLLNVGVFAALFALLLWSIYEVAKKRRFQKPAGFLIAMLAVVYGNCMLQMLTNSYSMTPAGVKLDQIFYIPVEDKWWWYSFGYVALWAIGLTLIYIVTAFLKEQVLKEGIETAGWYRVAGIVLSFTLCLITVNQYAYHGNDLQSYKAENMFTIPSKMQGNFTEYSFMQKDDHFFIVTSSKPDGLDWYYNHNTEYFSKDIEERTNTLQFGEGGLGIHASVGIPSLYVHKCEETNQLQDGAYVVRLYDADGTEIGSYKQLDTDIHREYICFYFDGTLLWNIAYAEFEYEDGTPAYIEGPVRMGYCVN